MRIMLTRSVNSEETELDQDEYANWLEKDFTAPGIKCIDVTLDGTGHWMSSDKNEKMPAEDWYYLVTIEGDESRLREWLSQRGDFDEMYFTEAEVETEEVTIH